MTFFSIVGCAVFTLLFLAILLELAARAVLPFVSDPYAVPNKARAASPVYAGYPWAHDFWREESVRSTRRQTYVPFRIWGVEEWQGKYEHNDSGPMGIMRRTVNPACVQAQKTVWIFGGSTVYGTGVPDFATLPSYLSRQLNQAGGACAVVFNFGVEGYVSNQEFLLLAEQIKAGRHPDIVIFYDGINDAATAQPGPGPPEPHFDYATVKSRVEGSLKANGEGECCGGGDLIRSLRDFAALRLARTIKASLLRKQVLAPPPEALHARVVATVDNYEANLRLAKDLSKACGFKLYWFWQPSLFYGHKAMVPFEEKLGAKSDAQEKIWSLVIAEAYREAERRAAAGGDFAFLGGLFDSVNEPLYIDQAHLGPRGNELAAQALARYIEDHP